MNKNKNLKSACEQEDARKERVERVSQILEGVHYKTESEKAEAIISFSKANLNYEEIEQLVKRLRPDYMTGQVYKKGVF